MTWSEYVGSGDFLEATFENWESEFLQMEVAEVAFDGQSRTIAAAASAMKPP